MTSHLGHEPGSVPSKIGSMWNNFVTKRSVRLWIRIKKVLVIIGATIKIATTAKTAILPVSLSPPLLSTGHWIKYGMAIIPPYSFPPWPKPCHSIATAVNPSCLSNPFPIKDITDSRVSRTVANHIAITKTSCCIHDEWWRNGGGGGGHCRFGVRNTTIVPRGGDGHGTGSTETFIIVVIVV